MSQPPTTPPPSGWPPPQGPWPPPQQGWGAPQPNAAPQSPWLPPQQQPAPPVEYGPPMRSGPIGDWPPPAVPPYPGPPPQQPPAGATRASSAEEGQRTGAVATLAPPTAVPRAALDHPVFTNPAPAVAWWHKQRAALRGRIVSLVLNVVIWGALWWFTQQPDNALGWTWGTVSWWIAGVSVGVSVLLIGWAFVQHRRARRAVNALHEGLALGVGRGGLYLEETYLRWSEIAGLDVLPGRLGSSARLVVRTASGGRHTLPLDYLAGTPASLDGAIRALSGGRAWLDLARLDD